MSMRKGFIAEPRQTRPCPGFRSDWPVARKVLHLSPDGPVIVMTGRGSSPSSGNRLGSSAFVNTASKVVSGRPSVIEFEIGRIYLGCSRYRPRVSKLATNTPARATIPSRVALIPVPHRISSSRKTDDGAADGNAQPVAGVVRWAGEREQAAHASPSR